MNSRKALREYLYTKNSEGKCHYCGIAEKDFVRIWGTFYGNKRGHNLEVDRKNNNKGYTRENCVLACAICNNAKSDKFECHEFQEVGKAIAKIWPNHKNPIAA